MHYLSTALMLLLLACPARSEEKRAGKFDYYLLSLSWSPTWCALEGEARNSPQCDDRASYGWVLHGLWPQFQLGYPSHCHSDAKPPDRRMTRAMADIMGSSGSAWYQWNKHGNCSGLSAKAYYALARRAYEGINRPEVFRRLDHPVRLPAAIVEEAFIKANPGLTEDMITVTCTSGRIQEARICLSKSLDFIPCGEDVRRDCILEDALFDPIP